MQVVIQHEDSQPIYDIVSALSVADVDFTLWNPNKISLFDMYHQLDPDLLIVRREFGNAKFDEIVAAKERANNSEKVAILDMDFEGHEFFGFPWTPCYNLVSNINVPANEKYVCDVAIILDRIENQDGPFLESLFAELNRQNRPFRIYSNLIDSPNCVGLPEISDYKYIYKNTKILLDIYEEYGYNAYLHGNSHIKPFSVIDTIQRIDDPPKYKKIPQLNHNFANVVRLLEQAGLNNEARQVKLAEGNIINEYWNFG